MKKSLLLLGVAVLIIILVCFTTYVNQAMIKSSDKNSYKPSKKRMVPKKKIKNSYLEQTNTDIFERKFSNRLEVPLILQTDKRWKDEFYGLSTENPQQNSLAINGCAIVSLAMIASFIEKKEVSPLDVLEWSGSNYFIENQGTSWDIFSDFSVHNNYICENLGFNIELVKKHLSEGHPVVTSVKPGIFTKVGHIMVLSGYDEKNNSFWVNDPNDAEEKENSQKSFSQLEIELEVINYWTIYK